jgi:ankyrin repeat protein
VKKNIVVLVVLALTVGCATVSKETSRTSAETPNLFNLIASATAQDVQSAIRDGADVNARDLEDNTPLMGACYFQRFDVIAMLLKAGADINARSSVDGRTALMWAAMNYETPDEIIKLLEAGADAKVMDKMGKTALGYAQDNWRFKGSEGYRRLQEASK